MLTSGGALSYVFICFLGVVFGLATSAGVFALWITLGITTRIVAKSRLAKYALVVECAMSLGGIVGCIFSLWTAIRIPLGNWITIIYGLCAGIFVGCQAVALAEILNMFPIMFRRMKLMIGLNWVLWALALGKLCGSFVYWAYK